jgi:hypothetical protein
MKAFLAVQLGTVVERRVPRDPRPSGRGQGVQYKEKHHAGKLRLLGRRALICQSEIVAATKSRRVGYHRDVGEGDGGWRVINPR